uniref:Ribosomal protein L34 n=1 Tax=Dicranema revolutum TaxID=239144 RepID=A0A4D6WUC8_9FLOR|nr:ribosomal protein L34 [Dicranema revolutum]
MSKRTLQGSNRKRISKSGFRARIRIVAGRKILKQRRRKGRKQISL